MQVENAWSIGDYAVAETVLTGTNTGSLFGRKATRKSINFRSLDIVQMRAAKILRGASFADGLELARQLGWEARVLAP
jgi:predicted ester cyclase